MIFFVINALFFQKSVKFATSCQSINFSQSWYFLNEDFFFFFCKCIIILFKIDKIHYFVPLNVETNFPWRWNFLNERLFFFPMNTLLFHGKSPNFATNCRNMNFPNVCYFWMHNYFFAQICCYFAITGEICD